MAFRVAKQLTNMPTRKLTVGSLVAPAISQGYSKVIPHLVEMSGWWWLDAFNTFGMATIVGTLVAVSVAWFVPDAPNEEVENDVENSSMD